VQNKEKIKQEPNLILIDLAANTDKVASFMAIAIQPKRPET